ncbi:MAG: hypothetical protein COB53_08430 [Elusimicrobia bacterium]|nr:MAG: hypothetical protein COB53_08430 [Elusimicrobiota bacterium]
MLRKLLTPILTLALVTPGALPAFADEAQKKYDAALRENVANQVDAQRGRPAKTELENYLFTVNGKQVKNNAKAGVFLLELGMGGLGKDVSVEKFLKEIDGYLDALEGDEKDIARVKAMFRMEVAKQIQAMVNAKKDIDPKLREALLDRKKMAELLGSDNEWTRRILLDAVASNNPERLARLSEELKKSGKTDLKEFFAHLEELKNSKDPQQRKKFDSIMQAIDSGKQGGTVEFDQGGDSARNNQRTIKRTKDSLASIGFSGAQAYGRFGDRHVYQDSAGNTISLSLATITRPDGTKEDLITVVNMNDPANPQGTSYSLRSDAKQLQAGVSMTLGGVEIKLQVGAGGTISISGPGGEMVNGTDPPSGPMGLTQLYAYRAARVYQYGKVVTIGGKQYYAAPETYGLLQGEGELTELQGFGQITYWPADDLRKIFGEEDPPGSGDWIDKFDPQTFDAKDLDLSNTRFAAGFNTLRPELGATVVKREGLQDVQILRASAGQDSEGRWWDAVWKNGEYVMEPGSPPGGQPGQANPGSGGSPIPAEKLEKLVAGLNGELKSRVTNPNFAFVPLQNGHLGVEMADATGKKSVFPIALAGLNDLDFGFVDDTALFYVDGGAGHAYFVDTRKGFYNSKGELTDWVHIAPTKDGGFKLGNTSNRNEIDSYEIFSRLISNRLQNTNPKFQISSPNSLQSLINAHLNEKDISFGTAEGNQKQFIVMFRKDGKDVPYTYDYKDGKWTETAGVPEAVAGSQVEGDKNSFLFQKGGDTSSPGRPVKKMVADASWSEGSGKQYVRIRGIGDKASGVYLPKQKGDTVSPAALRLVVAITDAEKGVYKKESENLLAILGPDFAPALKKQYNDNKGVLTLADLPKNFTVAGITLPKGSRVTDFNKRDKFTLEKIRSRDKSSGGVVLIQLGEKGAKKCISAIAAWGNYTIANACSKSGISS